MKEKNIIVCSNVQAMLSGAYMVEYKILARFTKMTLTYTDGSTETANVPKDINWDKDNWFSIVSAVQSQRRYSQNNQLNEVTK